MLHHFLAFALVLSVSAVCVAQPKGDSDATSQIVGLLEKSGHKYTKISDGVWEINFAGDNLKDFSVRLALAPNMLVTMAKIASRKELKLDPAFLTKLLELNHSLDSLKLALSEDMLYVRMDTRLRLLDTSEFKYVIDQMSGGTDEIYPQIKSFITASK